MFAVLIDCRNRMMCRQLGQLNTPVEQEGADTGEESIRTPVYKSNERVIDLADGAGVENLSLHSHCWRGSLQACQRRFGTPTGRVDKYVNMISLRQKLTQKFQSLCHDFGREDVDSRQVAVRLCEAGDET